MKPVQTSLFGDAPCPGARQSVTFPVHGKDDDPQPRNVVCEVCGNEWALRRTVGVITDVSDWTGRSTYLLPDHSAG